MRGLFTIYRRELAGLFYGPLAWILLGLSMLLSGWFFVGQLRGSGGLVSITLQESFAASPPLWILPPLLTMRMLSEESRSGMLEYLLTAPITDASVVVGKWLAAVTFMAIFCSSKLIYALTIQLLGTSPDWPVAFGAFFGAVLVSALFCAGGLLASSLTNVPALAAFFGLVANVLIFLLPTQVGLFDLDLWRNMIFALDVELHLRSFAAGILDTAGLVAFAVWSAMLLFLAVRSVESRRWR